MKQSIMEMLAKWLEIGKPTVDGMKYTIKNPLVILRKRGKIKLTDGYEISFDKDTKEQYLSVAYFALINGIHFGNGKYQWKFDQKKGLVTTHQGITFRADSIGLLDETYLYQIHFSSFDLRDKVVITAGAYKGDTPLFYAYYGARVYAFEPSLKSFEIAKENIALNPSLKDNIILRNNAIGDDGVIEFPLDEDSAGSSIYETSGHKTTKIRSLSITTILEEFNIKEPYLLDLDIKGAEFTVANDESLSRFKKIRIEYSLYLLRKQDKTLEWLVNKLESFGFKKIRIYKHNCLRFDLEDHGTLEAEK